VQGIALASAKKRCFPDSKPSLLPPSLYILHVLLREYRVRHAEVHGEDVKRSISQGIGRFMISVHHGWLSSDRRSILEHERSRFLDVVDIPHGTGSRASLCSCALILLLRLSYSFERPYVFFSKMA
jgi:hypothetical protein